MSLKSEKTELNNPNWDEIKTELNKLDGVKIGYFILENDNKDYIQCAGKPSALTVEYRSNLKPKFKHYVIGKRKITNWLKVKWHVLQTTVGDIMVHKHEVLNLEDAELIFKEFYQNRAIPTTLNKRNVTKLHTQK